jgi:large subunit ribosomal protein L21
VNSKKFAIVKIYGRQYRVSEGDVIKTSKIDAAEGTELPFHDVLAGSNGELFSVGAPTLKDAQVTAKVLSHGRDKKVLVFKYLRKNENKKMRGHRQQFTKLSIMNVQF